VGGLAQPLSSPFPRIKHFPKNCLARTNGKINHPLVAAAHKTTANKLLPWRDFPAISLKTYSSLLASSVRQPPEIHLKQQSKCLKVGISAFSMSNQQ
jgi:hypothetical protein